MQALDACPEKCLLPYSADTNHLLLLTSERYARRVTTQSNRSRHLPFTERLHAGRTGIRRRFCGCCSSHAGGYQIWHTAARLPVPFPAEPSKYYHAYFPLLGPSYALHAERPYTVAAGCASTHAGRHATSQHCEERGSVFRTFVIRQIERRSRSNNRHMRLTAVWSAEYNADMQLWSLYLTRQLPDQKALLGRETLICRHCSEKICFTYAT